MSTLTSNAGTRTIGIIGSGFSGTMVAVHLCRATDAGDPRVLLFEKGDRFARGVAYGTHSDVHLLNVAAGLMSAFPDEPGHFVDWLRERDPGVDGGSYISRKVYGDYLEDLLREARSSGKLELIQDEVMDLWSECGAGRGWGLRTASGATSLVDAVVLALGHPPAQNPCGLEDAEGLKGYIRNPWSEEALAGLDRDADVLLIGTGLTAIDLIMEASALGHRGKVWAVSRHGLVPQAHRTIAPGRHFAMSGVGTTARQLLRAVRVETARREEEGGDWRSVIDGIRPVAQRLWQSLDLSEKERFVRHLASRWEVHRHRMAPEVERRIEGLLTSRQLTLLCGRVSGIVAEGGRLGVELEVRGDCSRVRMSVDRVVNCTGPGRDHVKRGSELIRNMEQRGLVRPGPLALGLEAASDLAVLDDAGQPQGGLYAIGPLLRGSLWETTAVRELRTQAQELAERLIGRASVG